MTVEMTAPLQFEALGIHDREDQCLPPAGILYEASAQPHKPDAIDKELERRNDDTLPGAVLFTRADILAEWSDEKRIAMDA